MKNTPQKDKLGLFCLQTGGQFWTGGTTYKKNLLTALLKYCPEIDLYLVDETNKADYSSYENIRFIYTGNQEEFTLQLIQKAYRRFCYYDYALARAIKKVKIDMPKVCFTTKYNLGKSISTLFWIPDFQFIHLPEMYSLNQIKSLEKSFRKGIMNCNLVVLSSNDALKDLKLFMPEALDKARVVSFVASVPENLYNSQPNFILDKYKLPKKFLYLPNQFWKHKNHLVVFEALKILKDRGKSPYLVLTGNPVDSRNPLFFAELINKISLWGLREEIALLGLVDHEDVYHLIRQSVCVLNPSLFEGLSTTVEEAKSVGKRMILSDLAVHREQNPPLAKYFNPKDPEELANIIDEVWETTQPGPDFELENLAQKELPQRMEKFAKTFLSVAKEAVQRRKN